MDINVNALVLGLGINGLAVVRSLGEQGLKVAGVFNDRKSELGIHSKYLSGSHVFDSKKSPGELFRICKKLTGDSGERPVIICTTDLFSELVASHTELFESSFILTTPDKDLYWRFLYKQPTAQICMDNHLKIPMTVFVKEDECLFSACENMNYPAIIKPDLTYEETFPGKVVVVNDRQELNKFISKYSHLQSKVVIQEVIPSGDGKLYIVSTFSDKDGRVKSIYTGKKLRSYLPDFGVTCYGVSCEIETLKSISEKFLNDISYTGFADLEFAYNEETDEYYFIELNIRTSYLNQLYKDSGINLNYIGYLASKGLPFEHLINEQKQEVYWCDFTRDVGSFYRKYKSKKIGLIDWVRDLVRSRSYAYFSISDLKPYIFSIHQTLSTQLSKIIRS